MSIQLQNICNNSYLGKIGISGFFLAYFGLLGHFWHSCQSFWPFLPIFTKLEIITAKALQIEVSTLDLTFKLCF